MESKLEDGQCGFRPGRSTTDQIFTLKQIFEKSWEYGKDLFASFVYLEKAYDWVPRDKLWKVLRKYGVDGQLLRAIKSLRWGRGRKAGGQGQGHKKNPRPRPRTKDQAQVLSKKMLKALTEEKKKVFTKIFQAISTKKRFPKNVSSAPQNFNNLKNTAVLEPRTGQFSRTWGLEAKAKDLIFEAKDFKMCPRGQGRPRGLNLC